MSNPQADSFVAEKEEFAFSSTAHLDSRSFSLLRRRTRMKYSGEEEREDKRKGSANFCDSLDFSACEPTENYSRKRRRRRKSVDDSQFSEMEMSQSGRKRSKRKSDDDFDFPEKENSRLRTCSASSQNLRERKFENDFDFPQREASQLRTCSTLSDNDFDFPETARLKTCSNSSQNSRKRGSDLQKPQASKRAKTDNTKAPTTCHHCQIARQPEIVACKICSKRWCRACRLHWFPEKTQSEIMDKCPSCLLICNCKKCLRKKVNTKLEASIDEKKFCYAFLLKTTYPILEEFNQMQLRELEREAGMQQTRTTALQFPVSPPNRDRASCDNHECQGSIVDLHRFCTVCNKLLCLKCCQKIQTSYSLISCIDKHCEGVLELTGIYKSNWVANLTRKARKYMNINLEELTPSDWIKADSPQIISEQQEHPEKWRISSSRQNSTDNLLYCPTAKEVKNKDKYRTFRHVWAKGQPVIVRKCLEEATGLSWDPSVMTRSCRDKTQKDKGETAIVVNCRTLEMIQMNIRHFFHGYRNGFCDENGQQVLYKLKDWPPETNADERIPRHGSEFITTLPFPQYTHSEDGLLNIAQMSAIPTNVLAPDLGPKLYIAYGALKTKDFEGSVTHLHLDVSDAVNLLAHAKRVSLDERNNKHKSFKFEVELLDKNKEDDGHGGALWDIFRREDVPQLEQFLMEHRREFKFKDKPIEEITHPIFDQIFYLNEKHKKQLKEEYGVEPWTFEQYIGEIVFIPAGCPHQVKNLKSCTKIAMDFVTPENAVHCVRVAEGIRRLPSDKVDKTDKLEVVKLLLHAVANAEKELDRMN